MTVVPIRLSRDDARKLDLLVKLGVYRNRTEAMRSLVHENIDEHIGRYVLSEKAQRVLDQLLKYEKAHSRNPLTIVTNRTSVEIVAEGREQRPHT